MAKFNKASFILWAGRTLSLTREDAGRLYDEIGTEIHRSLLSGDSVNLFGQGILQVQPRRATGVLRVAYRPPAALEPGAIRLPPADD